MRRTALLLTLVAACSTRVDPTNPYDPATPADRQAPASVRGVLDASAVGSSGGIVVYLKVNNEVVTWTETTSTVPVGSFHFDGVVPGSYAITSSPTGFVPITIPVNLAAGQVVDLGTITLSPLLGEGDAVIIEGTVTLQDETFHGGTLVETVGSSFTTVTDSGGGFRLVVVEGTYRLRFTHADFVSQETSDFAVVRGEHRNLTAVQLLANPATIEGDVVGELAAGGQGPIAGALVTADGSGRTTTTDSNGHFVLDQLPAGSYLVRIARTGYVGGSVPVLNVVGGERRILTDPVTLVLARGRLAGTVALADSSDASGCVVEVTGTGRAAVTVANGQYGFDGLLEGTYEVTARHDGYWQQVRSSLTVVGGQTTPVSTMTLARQGGTVTIEPEGFTSVRTVTLRLGAPVATGYMASEDPSFASSALGDTAWQAYGGQGSGRAFTLSNADGAHTVYVVYWDGASRSSVASASVVLDRATPSSASVTIGTGGAYAGSSNVTLNLSAIDAPAVPGAAVSGLDRMYVGSTSSFGAATSLSYALTWPWTLAAGEGLRTVWVWFSDHAGNVSDPVQASVTVDTVAPNPVSLALSGGAGAAAGYTGTPVVTAALSAADANGGAGNQDLLVRLSNSSSFPGASWVQYATSVAWVVTPGDGLKTVYAQFRDPAGNDSLPASANVTLLSTPPSSGTISVAGGAAATSSQLVTAAISAVGAARMRISVNGVPVTGWDAYATTTTVNLGATPDEANRVISVSFRNAAGVEGGGTSTTIRFDQTPPGPGGIALSGSLGNGTTSSAHSATAAIVATLTPPAGGDAAEMAIEQLADPLAACSSGFAAPSWQPVARTATVVLTGADGNKKICVLFRDAAQNSSRPSAVGATIRLDTTPPTNPTFVNVASGTTHDATAPATGLPVITASTDTGTSVTYQCTGGVGTRYGPSWRDCGTDTTLPYAWILATNQESTLGLRARDDAYNYSPGSFVRVVHDSVAPFPPFITDIRSSRDSVTVTWDGAANTDVAQYLVHYGNVAGQLGGTGAAQGASPIPVGAFAGVETPSFTLTGLTPGLPYYLAIEAVDAAGNRSGPSGERLAVPARANPRVLTNISGQPRAVATVVETFDDLVPGNDRTFAYLGENQGIVQLDASLDTSIAVVGRAHIPDLVPDSRNGVVAFSCTRGVTRGHCVIAAGSTLEGDYRGDADNYRASAPIVFFPLNGTAAAPAIGTVEGILPGRPSFVFAVPSPEPSEMLVYTVDREAVHTYAMSSGRLSRLREVATHAYGGGQVASILGATLAWGDTELDVYARLDATQTPRAPRLFSFDVSSAWDGDISNNAAPTPLYASTVAPLHYLGDLGDASAPEVQPVMGGGIFMSFARGSGLQVASYVAGNAYPQRIVQVGTSDMSIAEGVSASGIVNGHLHVTMTGDVDGNAASVVPVTSGYILGTPSAVPGGDSGNTSGGAVAFLDQLSRERLLIVGSSSDTSFSLQRWAVTGTTTPTATPVPAATFQEHLPIWFTEADRFLYVADGNRIRTIDVSNPLAPTTPSTYTATEARGYWKLAAHGRYLYALDTWSHIDVFKRNSGGDVSFVTSVAVSQPNDFAIAGRYLFTANWQGIAAHDLVNVPSSGTVTGSVDTIAVANGAKALDARQDTVGGTYRPAVVHASVGSDSAPVLATYTFDGSTLTTRATTSYTGVRGNTVTVRGDYTAVSTGGGTWMFSGGSTPSPSGSLLPVAGPALLQAGYVVGLANDDEPSGPAFVARATAAVDGAIRFEACGRKGWFDGSSLTSSNGLYAASCGRNGITLFTPIAREGGRLIKAFEVSTTWDEGAALASDGMYTWFGGANYGSDSSRLYYVNEQSLADTTSVYQPYVGAYLQNATFTGADPNRTAVLMQHLDGTLFVVASRSGSVTVDAWDPTGWDTVGRYTFPTTDYPTAIATDGEYLFVGRGARLDVVDARTPTSMSLARTVTYTNRTIRSLAHARNRLYVGMHQDSVPGTPDVREIRVHDTANLPASIGTLTTIAPTGGPTGSVVGIAVSGRTLYATIHDPAYQAPEFGLVAFGLGANLDGAGATFSGPVAADQPIASPIVAGDTLLVAANLGTKTYDLSGLLGGTATLPVEVGGVNLADPFWTATWGTRSAPQLRLEGPFGFLVKGSYRVFDLR